MPHFQLVVPNYDNSGSADAPPLTYLRLGAAWGPGETLPVAYRGDDLVAGTTFMDDARHADGRTKPGKTYYRDDGVQVQATSPSSLTAELLTRGGVREHTDGNRISTTRGDCLEVVGGNYKLVIMGRVEGPHVGASSWESSGGHNHDSTSTPGEVTSITWSTAEDGTWQVTEETEKGEVHSYFKGRYEDIFYGPTKKEYVGQSVPPAIVERTYATSIEELSVVDTAEERTTISGALEETANITGLLRDRLYYKSGNTQTVLDQTGTADAKIGTFSAHVLAPILISQSAYARYYEKYGGTFTTKLIIGAELNVSIGTKLTLRSSHLKFGVNVAYSFELSVAAKIGVKIGVWAAINCMYEEKVKLAPLVKIDLGTVGAAVTRTKIALVKYKAKLASNRTQASSDST